MIVGPIMTLKILAIYLRRKSGRADSKGDFNGAVGASKRIAAAFRSNFSLLQGKSTDGVSQTHSEINSELNSEMKTQANDDASIDMSDEI